MQSWAVCRWNDRKLVMSGAPRRRVPPRVYRTHGRGGAAGVQTAFAIGTACAAGLACARGMACAGGMGCARHMARPMQPPPWSTRIVPGQQKSTTPMAPTSSRRIGRRAFLTTTGVAAGSGAITGFPTIWAQNIKNVTLRQFGTGVSNLNAVAEKVKQDLGFTLTMTALDTDAVTQKAVTQPKSYDIADIEYFTIKKVFPTGVMQPMDAKLTNPLILTSRL